jgi:phospholipid/cholesterol/gamma-HCH transport system substrate-binding protein
VPPQIAEPAPPQTAVADYDPATGSYLAPDGRTYTQGDLAQTTEGKTWQDMMTPPN